MSTIHDYVSIIFFRQTFWDYVFFANNNNNTLYYTTLVQTSIILGLLFKVLLTTIFLLACVAAHFVLFRWKMCNILIPCKCSTGRLAHITNIFHVLWVRKYNYNKKMQHCVYNTLCIFYVSLDVILSIFGPPWFAKLLEPFQNCCYCCCIIWCELMCVWNGSTCKLTGCCSGNFFLISH
jgi:hypothetical protein